MRYYDAKDVLAAMAELYRHKKHWTKGAFARNKFREDVSWNSPAAICYCMSGAVKSFSGEISVDTHVTSYLIKAIRELFPHKHWRDLPHFNDTRNRTIEHVRRVVGRARELAE